MILRNGIFHLLYFFFLYVFTEVVLRLVLVFYGYTFFKPSDYIYNGFYKNVRKVQDDIKESDDSTKRILILGGSVISTGYMHLEERLDTMLRKEYGMNKKFAFYNIAYPAHTSLDNLLKYKLLKNEKFDLVLYYEAINDLHANNTTAADFRDDYSHIKWYDDIYLLLRHSEIDISVIPYLVDMAIHNLINYATHRTYLDQYGANPQLSYADEEIKTRKAYEKNLSGIISEAMLRGDKLLLISYASYFPANVNLKGTADEVRFFSPCVFATPVTMWGESGTVKKGIVQHNAILRKLVAANQVSFLDMENRMPKDSTLFCDVCHVSEPGAQRFAHEIVQFIIRQKAF